MLVLVPPMTVILPCLTRVPGLSPLSNHFPLLSFDELFCHTRTASDTA